jgi:hypothetical protein
MRKIIQKAIVVTISLWMLGCTPPIDDKARDTAQERAAEDATQMRDAIQQPIQKAQEVEEITLKAAEDQREVIDEAAQ